MRVARYSDRFFLELTDTEYVATHRRFNENRPERLRATLSVSGKDNWVSIQIEPSYSDKGNVFIRTKTGWAVSFSRSTPGLDTLPTFALSNVGRFDPDDTGLEMIPFPAELRPPIEKKMDAPFVGEMVTVTPPTATGHTALGATVVLSTEPSPPKTLTQEEYLSRLKRAAKILNNGHDRGYVAKFDESGKIIKISTPDVEI